jgi:Fe-S cluster biogenesis protein NfuA
MSEHHLTQSVLSVLRQVEPSLGLHGGSVELVEITAKNVVRLRFQGACVGCSAASITLEYGLKELIMMQIDEVYDVEAVNTEPITHDVPVSAGH